MKQYYCETCRICDGHHGLSYYMHQLKLDQRKLKDTYHRASSSDLPDPGVPVTSRGGEGPGAVI